MPHYFQEVHPMKKLICFLFAFLFLLSAAGCGGKPIDTSWMENPDTTVSEVGTFGMDKLHSSALNADQMTISSVVHLPIYKFDTLEGLTQFKSSLEHPERLSASLYSYDGIPSFNEATGQFNETFFSENALLLVYVGARSGTYRFAVDAITGDGTGLCVRIAETTHAEVVTDDTAGWFITVAVPDSAAAAYTEFDAVLAEGSDR